MLTFKMIFESKTSMFYEYFPEGKDTSGIIEYNKETGEIRIAKLAENDEHRRYALQMFSRIRNFIKKNEFQENGMVAWV